jgi:hypothetical protein
LTGRWDEIEPALAGWRNLERILAPAVLLRAAAADLGGRPDVCAQQLELVAETWPTESDHVFLLAGLFLHTGRERDVRRLLSRWPVDAEGRADARPLYLAGKLAVHSGRKPDLVQPPPADERIPAAAWELLRAESALVGGYPATALEIGTALCDGDAASEAVVAVLARALRRLGEPSLGGDLDIPRVWPDRVLMELVPAWYRCEQSAFAETALEHVRRVQPERPVWTWLTPGFWLGPIRGWIG